MAPNHANRNKRYCFSNRITHASVAGRRIDVLKLFKRSLIAATTSLLLGTDAMKSDGGSQTVASLVVLAMALELNLVMVSLLPLVAVVPEALLSVIPLLLLLLLLLLVLLAPRLKRRMHSCTSELEDDSALHFCCAFSARASEPYVITTAVKPTAPLVDNAMAYDG